MTSLQQRAELQRQIWATANLVTNNYVETVISLAPNLFFGTTIAVNILVLCIGRLLLPRAWQGDAK